MPDAILKATPETMNSTQTTKQAPKAQLLHLSDISLNPLDIRNIEWDVTKALSGKVVTRIQTIYRLFVLESDSANYKADIEQLKEAVKNLY